MQHRQVQLRVITILEGDAKVNNSQFTFRYIPKLTSELSQGMWYIFGVFYLRNRNGNYR